MVCVHSLPEPPPRPGVGSLAPGAVLLTPPAPHPAPSPGQPTGCASPGIRRPVPPPLPPLGGGSGLCVTGLTLPPSAPTSRQAPRSSGPQRP